MLLQTNSYIVPKDRRSEHARLLRKFRQTLSRLGCDDFEVYEQVGANWAAGETGRFVQIMRFRDRAHQQAVQAAERTDPSAQRLIQEFCALINFPYQQQQGLFAVGFYAGALAAVRTGPKPAPPSTPGAAPPSPAPNPQPAQSPAPPQPDANSDSALAAPATEGASLLDFGALTAAPPAAEPPPLRLAEEMQDVVESSLENVDEAAPALDDSPNGEHAGTFPQHDDRETVLGELTGDDLDAPDRRQQADGR